MPGSPAENLDPRFQPRDDPSVRVFDTSPSKAIRAEFMVWVKKTGKPDTWRWHDHTKPPVNSRPTIVERFVIPLSLRPTVGKAPCPICSIRGPKYFVGMLAYFADEKSLRAIGHECGHQFFSEGAFAGALREFEEKRSDENALDFLVENLPKVPRARTLIAAFVPVARRADDLGRVIRGALGKKLAGSVVKRSEGGVLPLYEERAVPIVDRGGRALEDRDGNPLTKNESVYLGAYRVAGLSSLQEQSRTAEVFLYRADRALESLVFANDDKTLDALTKWGAKGRAEAVVRMREAWVDIRKGVEIIQETQAFLRRANLDNLIAWSEHPACPVRLYASFDAAGQFRLGHERLGTRALPIGQSLGLPGSIEPLT